MGKSKRNTRYDETDDERQERILTQLQRSGRIPTPQPGYFHDTDKRRDRKSEKARLRRYENDIEAEDGLDDDLDDDFFIFKKERE